MSALSPSGELSYENGEEDWMAAPIGEYVGATVFAYFSAAVCFYWIGFTMVNTYYVHEYTVLNQFNSGRYFWVDWWGVWMLTFNVSLPMLFVLALTYSNVRVWSRIHAFFSYITIIGTILSLIFLSIGWAFYCNNSASGERTACNDYRWCGFYYGQVGSPCTNGAAFGGIGSSGELQRNQQMTEHWIYCWVYLVFSVFHILMNNEFRKYGIFK